MKVLISGFDPFGGETINPAYEAVLQLPNEMNGIDIIKLELPTVFHQSIELLKNAIALHQPDVVICVGQAGGRDKISLERVAINIDDARIKDNAGNQPIDDCIVEGGPNAYFSSLPLKKMYQILDAHDIPVEISNTAGTFVCNHLMYGLLHHIQDRPIKGGFIHVPFIPEQVKAHDNKPSMALMTLVKGLSLAIQSLNQPSDETVIITGKLD